MAPLVVAATKIVAAALPALIEWIARELADGRDPEAALNALMTSAEDAARAAEQEKFGD